MTHDKDERDSNRGDDGAEIRRGDDGAIVRLHGSSAFISMYTQRGRKGINQDAMTVWEVKAKFWNDLVWDMIFVLNVFKES